MRLYWLSSAQVFLALTFFLPCFASAQAGETLSRPELTMPATAPSVQAQQDAFAFDLMATTSVPLSLGVEAQVETPFGAFANLSFGHTPSAYLQGLASVVQGAGVYDQSDGLDPLIEEATSNGGWNARFGIGVRVVEGLELSVGYTYLRASSTASAAAIEAAIGQRIPWPGMQEVSFAIDMHALHARIGYRLLVDDHFVVRAALGWTHTIEASARFDVPEALRSRTDNPIVQLEEAVGQGLTSYAFTPEIILSAGYRF